MPGPEKSEEPQRRKNRIYSPDGVAPNPLSQEEIDKIDTALTLAKGRIVIAAKAIGIPFRELRRKIYYTEQLKLKWHRNNIFNRVGNKSSLESKIKIPKDELQALDPTGSISSEEAALSEMVRIENKRLVGGLFKLGLTDSEVSTAIAMQQFSGREYRSILDINCSGLLVNSIRMLNIMRFLEERIEAGIESVEEETLVFDAYVNLNKEYRNITSLSLHGSVVRARLAQLEKERNKARPNGGAAFAPKRREERPTNIVAEHVTINNPAPAPIPLTNGTQPENTG